jgi:hydrogenase large subunit
VRIPPAANAIRNLITAQQFVHDHVMHFYHLHALDWVDVLSALDADPADTAALQKSISDWPNNTAEHFAEVQARVQAIVDSGRLSLFANGYWGHPGYKLPPAANLLALAHYFEALDWQSQATTIHVVFGGKNPHPNFVVGGVPLPIDMDSEAALNGERLDLVRDSIGFIQRFVAQVYWPDLLAIGPHYTDYAKLGEGLGNFLTWGEFPATDVADLDSLLVPRGLIVGRDLAGVTVPDPRDSGVVREFVARSWYEYRGGNGQGLHPWDGETELAYSGPQPPYELLDTEGEYSWLKAPRYGDLAVEVGPLARVLVMHATGNARIRELTDEYLFAAGLSFDSMYSTLGRTAARAIETELLAEELSGMLDRLEVLIAAGETATFNDESWDVATWPRRAQGFGYVDAPRGALGHWIVIEDDRIANYQMVVPTTWNASPRDGRGQPGAYEAALVGTRLARRDEPLEILRTVHSFDPCMACAVHLARVGAGSGHSAPSAAGGGTAVDAG